MKRSNGVYEFSKIMFKADIKATKFYIVLITITVAFILNLINVSYNNIYAEKNLILKKVVSRAFKDDEGFVELPLIVIQKQNLLIVVCITILFAAICNMNYIKRKSKEIAFMITNGSSIADISRYLLYLSGRCYVIAVVIGVPIGIILIPIFNLMIYSLMGKSGPIFAINIEGLLISLVYIFMQYLALVILNVGFIVRRSILDLMKVENTISFVDKRQVKIPGSIFIVIYILAVIPSFFGENTRGSENLSYVLSFVGLFGIYGIIEFFIPKFINKIKKREFMFKGCRSIYVSNFLYSLSSSLIYVLALVFILNYFTFNIVEYGNYQGIKEMSIFSIIFCCIIISFSLVYKLLIDTNEKMHIYKQLKILGYEKEHICKIVKREAILIFIVVLMLPIILIISALFKYAMVGIYSFKLWGGLIFLVTLSLVLTWGVSSKINQKKVLEVLF